LKNDTKNLTDWCCSEEAWLKDQKDLDQKVTKRLGTLECVVGTFVATVQPKAGVELMDDGRKMARASDIDVSKLTEKRVWIMHSLEDAKDKFNEEASKYINDLHSIEKILEHLYEAISTERMATSYHIGRVIKKVDNDVLWQFLDGVEVRLKTMASSCDNYLRKAHQKI